MQIQAQVMMLCIVLCCVPVPATPSLYTKVLNSSVVQASWEQSSKMGQHQGFRLYYRRAHTPLFTGPFTFPRNVTRYNITQLGETPGSVCCSFYYFYRDREIDTTACFWIISPCCDWTSLPLILCSDPSLVYEIKLLAYNQHGDGNATVRFVSLREAVEKSGDCLSHPNTTASCHMLTPPKGFSLNLTHGPGQSQVDLICLT